MLVADVFASLGSEVRLRVVGELAGGRRSVMDLARSVGLTQPAASHHLTSLRHAGLVSLTREGKFNFYSLTPLCAALLPAAEKVVAKHGGRA